MCIDLQLAELERLCWKRETGWEWMVNLLKYTRPGALVQVASRRYAKAFLWFNRCPRWPVGFLHHQDDLFRFSGIEWARIFLRA